MDASIFERTILHVTLVQESKHHGGTPETMDLMKVVDETRLNCENCYRVRCFRRLPDVLPTHWDREIWPIPGSRCGLDDFGEDPENSERCCDVNVANGKTYYIFGASNGTRWYALVCCTWRFLKVDGIMLSGQVLHYRLLNRNIH